MASVDLLRIVVASPSDVQAERDALPAVIDELNRGLAATQGLRLELGRWETDTYPGFHPEGPQGLIDPILRIEDCDILLGIFWKRFGTPTRDASSGTEHEFLRAYAAWQRQGHPQIMLYFNQRAATPRSKAETDQWGQVLDFQQRFPKEGLWWPYRGKAQADQRRVQVKTAVEQFAAAFPKVRLLVTSCTYAYQRQDWKLRGFAEAVLTPFSRTQIVRFVERWYAYVGQARQLSAEDTQGRATLLQQAILRTPRLYELATRPLLLTLMASLHAWRGGTLPEQREALYADALDLLLDQ